MRRIMVLCLSVFLAATLTGCRDTGSSRRGTEDAVPPEAMAVLDQYFAALNEHDSEAFLAVVNPAVYEYVFSGTSFGVEAMMDGQVLDRFDQIAVKLEATISNTIFVAVSARRPDTEPDPVNGIMVIELTEFPDSGWLVTRDHRFGM